MYYYKQENMEEIDEEQIIPATEATDEQTEQTFTEDTNNNNE